MALTDPELDLLGELVQDDPGASAFLQVGAALLDRERLDEALGVLQRGIAASDDEDDQQEARALLVRCAFAAQRDLLVLSTLEQLPTLTQQGFVRLELLSLARAGRVERFLAKATPWLEEHSDEEIEGLARRLARSGQEYEAVDPMVNVDLAERHVDAGHLERAVRLYRRLRFQNPDDGDLQGRLREIEALMRGEDPSLPARPALMPLVATPSLGTAGDDEITSPTILTDDVELMRALALERTQTDELGVDEDTVIDRPQ